MRHYTQWDNKLLSARIISVSRIVMVLNDARFPYTYKAVLYAAKLKAGDCPYYLKSTIDYIKYLVTEMVSDQPRENHLDRSSSYKYWVNKLTSKSQHCNTWYIAEREKWNTIWFFWHQKQRESFSATCHFAKEKKNI